MRTGGRMTIRVAVIDGHTLTRYGLCGLLAQHPDLETVAEIGLASDAPAMVAASKPDVVTLDVTLPDGDGLRLARELRDRYPHLGIVLLTSDGQDDVLFRALETGVSAFVTKTAPTDEVLAAIRHAAVAAASFTATGLALALARRHAAAGTRLSLSPRDVRQPVDGQDIRVPAVRQARRLQPRAGADDRAAPGPDRARALDTRLIPPPCAGGMAIRRPHSERPVTRSPRCTMSRMSPCVIVRASRRSPRAGAEPSAPPGQPCARGSPVRRGPRTGAAGSRGRRRRVGRAARPGSRATEGVGQVLCRWCRSGVALVDAGVEDHST